MQRTPLIVAIVASLGLAGALAYAANSGAITRVSAPSARAALQTLQSAPAGRAQRIGERHVFGYLKGGRL